MEATKNMIESQFECAFNYIKSVARELAEYSPDEDTDRNQIVMKVDKALIRLETKRNILDWSVSELENNNWY